MNKKLFLVATLFCLNFVALVQATSTPVISRVYSDRFIGQEAFDPTLGSYGALDTIFGTSGSLSLSAQFSSSQAKAVKVLSDGSILVVLDNGTDTKVIKYTATGAVQTSGFGTSGVVTLTGLTNARSMTIDNKGRILVCGGSDSVGTAGWIVRIAADGSATTTFTGTTWRFVGAVAEQSSGKIIAVGHDGTNGKIARYTIAGALDSASSFGDAGSGIITLSGTPITTTGLYNVSIASNDKFLLSYKNGGNQDITKYLASGILDTAFDTDGILSASYLNGSTAAQNRLVIDNGGNIIAAAQVGTAIKLTGCAITAGGAHPTFANKTISDADTLNLVDLVATTDGNVQVISYTSDQKMRIDSITSAGIADTSFGTAGTLEFNISSPDTSAILSRGAVTPDGRIFIAGWQVHSGVTTPYLSRVYGKIVATTNKFLAEIAQQPVTVEQGEIDTTFGSTSTNDGIMRTFDGLYGTALQQKADAIIELASGKFLVGISGYTDTSATSNLLLTRLLSTGVVDTGFGTAGFSNLALSGLTDLHITSLVENAADNSILVSGYSATSGVIRLCNAAGTQTAAVSNTGILKTLGVLVQGTERVIAFNQVDATSGDISAYDPALAGLDVTFNAAGGVPGKVRTNDFSLTNMGPVYGHAIDSQNNIFVAYKNASTTFVDVIKIKADGSGLVTLFGTSGVKADIFGGAITNVSDVRLALDNAGDVIVAAVLTSAAGSYTVKRLFAVDGAVDSTFGTVTIPVGTAAVLNHLGVLSNEGTDLDTTNNNSIVLTGADNATDDSMITARVKTTAGVGGLDTTFNAQGATPGVLSIQIGNIVTNYYARSATGMAIQSSTGNMILTGYEQQTSSLSIPMVMRVFGQSGTTLVKQYPALGTTDVAGTLDLAFDIDNDGAGDGSKNLTSLIAAGSAKTIYAYRSGSAYQGYLLVGVDTGADLKIARIRESDSSLDTTFGTAGIKTLTGITGLNHISLDVNGKILVAGTQGGAGWAYRLTANGGTDLTFQSLAAIIGINAIYQQKSGRYIVVGVDSNNKGVIAAYKDKLVGSETQLQLDTTFNPLAATAIATAGLYEISTTGTIPTIAINTDDTILVSYYDSLGTNHINIAKLQANGGALVSGFGASGVKDTGVTPVDGDSIRVAVDSTNKVVVAFSVGGVAVNVVRYSSAGATDGTFNGTGAVQNITGLGSAGVTVRNLIIDSNDKILIFGNNTAQGGGEHGPIYAVRLGTDGELDPTWNVAPTAPDIAGVLTFTAGTSTTLYASSIFINGMIYAAGLGAGSKPLLFRMFGDNYVVQLEQQPFESAAGTIDTTLDYTGATGALNLNTYLSSLSLTSTIARKIHIYSDGSMLIAFNKGTTTIVAKLKKDFTLDTTGFNSAATGSPAGSVTVTNATTVSDMFVNDNTNGDACIYLTGTHSGVLWTAKYTSAGVVQSFTTTDTLSMDAVTAIRRTTNNRTIITGHSTNAGAGATPTGIVVAYKSDQSGLDLTFGNGTGYYVTDVDATIADIAVTEYDEMFITYKSGSDIRIDRILSNGSGLATSLWTTGTPGRVTITPGDAFSTTQIRLILDEINNFIMIAAQDGTGLTNGIAVHRYPTDGVVVDRGTTLFQVLGKTLQLADLFIDNTSTYPDMYVVGYNSTDSKAVVARMTATITAISQDNSYGSTGLANMTTGTNMTIVHAGGLHPDRRVYFVGQSAAPIPSISRAFGDAYVTQVHEENVVGLAGGIDLTLDAPVTTSPDGGLVISGLTGYTGRAIYANADGSSYVAFGNGTNLRVGKLNSDGNLVSSGFGTSGLTATITMTTVNSLIVDAAGKILVSGTNAGVQKVVRITSAGILDLAFSTSLGFTISVGTQVVEQKSGRVLVGGYNSTGSLGVVVAYQNTGLAKDSTFGPYGSNGFYSTGVNAQIDDIALDSYDNAYIVYRNTNIFVEKIKANGAGKDEIFGAAAAVDTGIAATSAARIAINNAGNILVGASTAAGVKTRLYNGTTGVAVAAAQTITSASSPVLTDLTGAGVNFVGSIYNTAPNIIGFRILGASGLLDTTTPFGTAGITTVDPETATSMHGITVRTDGRILMVGANATDPVIMSLYGDSYVAQYAQYPGKIAAGLIDTTLFPTSGALTLDDVWSSLGLAAGNYTGARIHTYTNDDMLILFSVSTKFILARVHKDFSLDTTGFNAAGTPGYITVTGLPAYSGIPSLYVDSSGNIFVGGGSGTSFMRAYDSTGTVLSGWTNPTDNLSAGARALAGQSMSRLILAGQNTNGMLYGYTLTGALDPAFGNGTAGQFNNTGVAIAISDISVNSNDDIILVYKSAGNASVLKLVYADGSAFSGTLPGTGTAISNLSGNGLKVIEDNADHIIVAGATVDGFTVARYDASNGANNGAQVLIPFGGTSTSYLTDLYTTSDSKTVLIGYESGLNYQFIARLKADFTLDETFGIDEDGVFADPIGTINTSYAGAVYNDNRIVIIGDDGTEPFMWRAFGDDYVTKVAQAPTLGVAGVIDTTFHTVGSYNIGLVDPSITNSQPKAVMTTAVGGHYITFDNTVDASQLIRTISDDILDTAYSTDGVADSAPKGVRYMMLDGSGRVLTFGADGTAGGGWIQRFTTAGAADATFGTAGLVQDGGMDAINSVVEQTLARVVTVGLNAAGNSALRAYTDLGVLDTTFNSLGAIPGEYSFDTNTNGIHSVVADSYDRLIIAHKTSTGVDVVRFTSNGELDTTFGTSNSGIIIDALTSVSSNPFSVHLTLDDAGNIVVVDVNSADTGVKVASFDNGIAASGNGAAAGGYTAGTPVTGLTGAVIRSLVATEDGKVLVCGSQSGNNAMWVARLTNTGTLDAAGFNPAAIGGTAGVMKFAIAGGAQDSRILSAMAIKGDGRISLVGFENVTSTDTPFLARAYNNPYQIAIEESPNSEAIGTRDTTLGVTTDTNDRVSFFASATTDAADVQVARAVALQGNNRILVALDGQDNSVDTTSRTFLSRFNIDGLLDTTFNTTGQVALPHLYENEYVKDSVAFTTPAGVNKAIIAGYAVNSVLSVTTSWLMQYNLDTVAVDSTFGGIDNDSSGTVSGDIKQFNTVARQASGRTIAAGLNFDNSGAILGYNIAGKLDKSFGRDGYYADAAIAGIYSHAIDSQDRVVFAYNNAGTVVVARLLADGSGLDTSFSGDGIETGEITGVISNDQIRVAVDSNDDIYVVAVNGGGLGVQYDVRHYSESGGVAGTGTIVSGNLGGITALTLARLLVDSAGKVTIIGADNTVNDDYLIVKLTAGLAMDTAAFNGLGYLKFKVDATKTVRSATSGILHDDGRILVIGSETA